MRKFISRFFLMSLLLTIASSAFADSNSQFTASAVTNHTDLSIAYLSQIFGTVGNVLHGTSGQMLGHLFYILNQGILIVAGIWLAYTTVTVVLKSAQEGSFMGVNKNAAVLFLKIALGFGLLMPNPATGYSVFQDVVMKVVVEGVALADLTWDNGLKYINLGGTLWRRPETGTHLFDPSKINGKFADPVKQVFSSEVCMIASNAYYQEQAANNSSSNNSNANNIANMGGSSSARHFDVVETKSSFQFPGIGNKPGLPDNEAGNCGSITWTNIKGASGSEAQFAKNAVSRIVYNVLPAAREYFCGSGSDLATASSECTDTTANYSQDVPQAFFGGLVDYVNAIYPLAQHQVNKAGSSAKDFMNCSKHSSTCAQSEGWMMAGRYYWDLSRIQSHLHAVKNISNYAPSAYGPLSQVHNVKSVSNVTKNALKDSKGFMEDAMTQLKHYASANNKGDTGRATSNFKRHLDKAGPMWIMTLLIKPIAGDFVGLVSQFVPGLIGPDPIFFLHRVGMDCIAIAGDIWLSLAMAIFGASALMTVCTATLNMNIPFKDVTDWVKPIFMMIATALLGVGVMLGYYVPLYPYMLFTFGVIGWIIAVIEAMVAAPLVCLGLTHPEGHDFLGAAQQALMLLLSIFLRPVLMVIGLIGGMIISYVSFRIIIYTFSGFIMDIFYLSQPTVGSTGNILLAAAKSQAAVAGGAAIQGSFGGVIMSLLVIPLMLIMFTMLVYVVTNQCFSLIYALPDNILRWIGGPQSQSMASQMAQELKGAASRFGQSVGQGVQKGLTGAAQQPKGQMDIQNDDKGGNDDDNGPNSPSSGGKSPKGGDPSSSSGSTGVTASEGAAML